MMMCGSSAIGFAKHSKEADAGQVPCAVLRKMYEVVVFLVK